MNRRFKKYVIILLAIGGAIIVGFGGWSLLPISARARVIRNVPIGDSYSRYERLARFLKSGMSIDEVRSILGKPVQENDIEGGRRWTFCDDGPTAGWRCIVDFAPDSGKLQLAYFLNVEHIVFKDSPRHEFGKPVDGGKFQNDPALKSFSAKRARSTAAIERALRDGLNSSMSDEEILRKIGHDPSSLTSGRDNGVDGYSMTYTNDATCIIITRSHVSGVSVLRLRPTDRQQDWMLGKM